MSLASIHLRITGRVQGVGFRWHVRTHAHRLQIGGWVRNNEDGSVEVAAEGREESLAEFRRLVAKGPPGAVVDEVTELDQVAEELGFPFAVRR